MNNNELEEIINEIDGKIKEAEENRIMMLKVPYHQQKKGEISPQQRKQILDYYILNDFKGVTAEGISKATGMTILKSKNFIGNFTKQNRTNNIKTVQILTSYLDELEKLDFNSLDSYEPPM